MKKIIITLALIAGFSSLNAQRSIDRLFEKYSDTDGYTCVTLSGNLLNLATTFEDDGDEKEIEAKITEVRILAQKDHRSGNVNFLDVVRRDLNMNDYEEFMRVKESDQDLRVLVRSNGRRISEFLLVSGGDENVLVQVKGDMSVSHARMLCEKAKKNNGTHIF